MESKYTKLIEELRRIVKHERGVANEISGDPEYAAEVENAAAAVENAADAIETLSRGIHVYAKENEALIAWRRNAEEWMNRVAEEKAAAYHRDSAAMRADETVNAAEKTPALSVLYLCDRRKCDRCNPECKHTEDVRHAKHFEVGEYGGYILEAE